MQDLALVFLKGLPVALEVRQFLGFWRRDAAPHQARQLDEQLLDFAIRFFGNSGEIRGPGEIGRQHRVLLGAYRLQETDPHVGGDQDPGTALGHHLLNLVVELGQLRQAHGRDDDHGHK